ncbi:hypothetical protein L208DRAFT_341110 [Tricholoma matsutake]|nr:hypothetical protein L208DRAFT_341110 [Tricholoma matsutake 945]
MTAAQRTNGSIPPTQAVPQIRSQVNISQQRTGTPSMPIGNQLRTAQQQAQQTQNQAQNNVSGNGPNNAHLPTPHGTRDITSSPAHVSPPHGSTVMPNVVNSPRPPSAQAHALLQVQVPGNAAPRPVPNMGNYYLSEQLQTALRLQMQQQHLQQQQTPQTPPNVFP